MDCGVVMLVTKHTGFKQHRRIKATLIAWANEMSVMKWISGENKEGLVKEARRILNEITPKGRSSKASLWCHGKVVATVKFSRKVKKQPQA